MKITADLHVHTHLSSCADSDALPESYFELCRRYGIKKIAFTDHFWDAKVEGASGWYAPQNLEHILQLRQEISSQPDGIEVLFGAETEFIGSMMCGKEGGITAILPETARLFDFILIPPDHFHMKGYTIPGEVAEPSEIRKWFISNFMEVAAVELGVPTGIAHPFVPMGFGESSAAILRAITDDDYRRCFAFAAEKGKSIELNESLLKPSLRDEYLRNFTIAREEGCKFHIGSDAHTPSDFGRFDEMGEFCDLCGISSASMTDPPRRV